MINVVANSFSWKKILLAHSLFLCLCTDVTHLIPFILWRSSCVTLMKMSRVCKMWVLSVGKIVTIFQLTFESVPWCDPSWICTCDRISKMWVLSTSKTETAYTAHLNIPWKEADLLLSYLWHSKLITYGYHIGPFLLSPTYSYFHSRLLMPSACFV
jgi:hypothetical protein